MRNKETILKDFEKGKELTPDEIRLVDLIKFKKTGKRLESFKVVKRDARGKKQELVILRAPQSADQTKRIEPKFSSETIVREK